jgi:hypothetical protein
MPKEPQFLIVLLGRQTFFEEQKTMLMNFKLTRWLLRTSVLGGTILLLAAPASSQTNKQDQVAQTVMASAAKTTTAPQPSFTDYRGIKIGMSADEVRSQLDHLQDKGKDQDFFVFSDTESAQVFYDKTGKVMGISIDYRGKESNPPAPRAVLGIALQPKSDGSMYDLKRYPEAGYWVAYNRTSGSDPTVTITMQKAQ